MGEVEQNQDKEQDEGRTGYLDVFVAREEQGKTLEKAAKKREGMMCLGGPGKTWGLSTHSIL